MLLTPIFERCLAVFLAVTGVSLVPQPLHGKCLYNVGSPSDGYEEFCFLVHNAIE
jgi:hypothetical protein